MLINIVYRHVRLNLRSTQLQLDPIFACLFASIFVGAKLISKARLGLLPEGLTVMIATFAAFANAGSKYGYSFGSGQSLN